MYWEVDRVPSVENAKKDFSYGGKPIIHMVGTQWSQNVVLLLHGGCLHYSRCN